MSSFKTYPNQRHIVINRDIPSKEKKDKGKFLSVYCNKITAAAQELSEVPFKLYIYLLCNDDKFDLWFSPKLIATNFGVGESTVRKAFYTLMECGYIIELDKNQFAFYEEPQKKSQIKITIEEEVRMIEQEDGTFEPYTYSKFCRELTAMGYAEPIIKEQWEAYK